MEPVEVFLQASGRLRPAGWNAFVPELAHPANTTEYADFHQSFGHRPLFLEVRVGGERVAQWLVFRRKRRFNPLAALFAECAPQLAPRALDHADDVFVACIEFLSRQFRPRELVLLKHALLRDLSESALRRSGFRRIVELRSFVTTIGGDDALLAGFHSSHRNDPRKALRDGYGYTDELQLDDYLELVRGMQDATGYAGAGADVIEAIARTLVPGRRALFSGVHAQDRLAAGSVILFAGRTAFYLYGASRPDKPRGATTYLHYENMRRLRALGVERYDFGGAGLLDDPDPKARSIAAFKERFGGTLVTSHGGSLR
jgi:SAM-dependent methyltransferase